MYGGYITLEAQPFWVIIAAIRALLRGLGAALLWALLRGGRRYRAHFDPFWALLLGARARAPCWRGLPWAYMCLILAAWDPFDRLSSPHQHLAFLLALDLSSTQLAPGYHSLDSPEATRLVRSAPGPLCVPLDPVWCRCITFVTCPPPAFPARSWCRQLPMDYGTSCPRIVRSVWWSDFGSTTAAHAAASLLSRARPPPFPPAPGAASCQSTAAHHAPASYEAFGGLILAPRPLCMPLDHLLSRARPPPFPPAPGAASCQSTAAHRAPASYEAFGGLGLALRPLCMAPDHILSTRPPPRLSRLLLVPPAPNPPQRIMLLHCTKRFAVSDWLYAHCAWRRIIFCPPARPPPFPPAPGAASSQSAAAHRAPASYEAFGHLGLALRSLRVALDHLLSTRPPPAFPARSCVWPSRIGSTLTARGAGSSFVHPPAPRLSRPLLVPPAPNPPQRIVPPHLMKCLAVSDWLYAHCAWRWIIFCPPARPPPFPPAPGAASSQSAAAHRAPASYEAFGRLGLALRPLCMPLDHLLSTRAPDVPARSRCCQLLIRRSASCSRIVRSVWLSRIGSTLDAHVLTST
ncbi:hypothetical protein DFH06DRAFT_1131428 [Mycena polygramma]|nr:hypothetical protein DFH06DRAFT_1131428 [Mycena polygramma]